MSDKQLPFKAVLFDLDGTLLDTALDLGLATNYVLKKYGIEEGITDETAREYASDGMRALIKAGIPKEQWGDYDIEGKMRNDFLSFYHEHINDRTVYFNGIENLLINLNRANIKFGIVTSKPHHLTTKLLSKFDLLKDLKAVVGCDLIPFSKPSPEPLFYACKMLDVNSDDCIYIGDHQRDVEAAHNANMKCAFALWGYIGNNCDKNYYHADYAVKTPQDFEEVLGI